MSEEKKKPETVDFRIISKPIEIVFMCPHCEWETIIPWEDIDVPFYWGDDWGQVKCSECGEIIQLGDYERE